MAFLKPGAPLTTRESFLLVENALPVGKYLFQLEVVDDDGERSEPVQVTVVVAEAPTRTTTVLDATRTTTFTTVSSPTILSPLRTRIP